MRLGQDHQVSSIYCHLRFLVQFDPDQGVVNHQYSLVVDGNEGQIVVFGTTMCLDSSVMTLTSPVLGLSEKHCSGSPYAGGTSGDAVWAFSKNILC